MFKSINPYTQELIAEHPLMDDNAIDRCLAAATTAFASWKKTSFEERAIVFKNLATLLKRDSTKLGTLITNEMGKVIALLKTKLAGRADMSKVSALVKARLSQ